MMLRVLFLFSALFLLFYSISHAARQGEEFDSKTIEELLLYYDWEDLLVEAPTRRPTKLKNVAENVSIITAEEIREMNAHSVNEILRIVTGLHIGFNEYFAGTGVNHIHTSEFAHNLILLDGVRINEVGEGYTVTTGIPVQIIDRIEIVKGPASSAWGSALGGVINIITKSGKNASRPTGTVYGSYGERESWDLRADVAGGSDKLRYYLYAGTLETDGLVTADASYDWSPDKYAESENAYAKFNFDPSRNLALAFSAGYWRERHLNIIVPELDWLDVFGPEARFVRGNLQSTLSPEVKLKFNIYYYDQTYIDDYDVLGTGIAGNAGDFYQEYYYEEPVYGGDTSLTWDKGRHSMLLGAEYYYGELKPWGRYGSYRQSQGFPAQEYLGGGEVTIPSIYINDTIKWDRFTLTPGLRYDHLNIADIVKQDLLNPSLGMTYALTGDTLLRATVARGFARPTVTGTAGWRGRVPLPGNPDIESSIAWSYQAGIESSEIEKLHLKADFFYHRLDKTFIFDADTLTYVNGDITEKKGFELNATAGPFHNFTPSLGLTYVRLDELENESDNFYIINAKLGYKNQVLGNITLFGRYIWYGKLQSAQNWDPEYDDMLWELHYHKEILKTEQTATDFFFSVRNLFNGAQYYSNSFQNPDRWVEAGLRFRF